jgi:hypothetical protein
MRKVLLSFILVSLAVALTGCFESKPQEEKFSGTGLSVALSLPKEAMQSSPINILAKVKNMANENATGVYAYLTGLDGWNVNQPLQSLNSLQAKDSYTFSWIAYAPAVNRTYKPKVELFYRMNTDARLVVRIYNNDYLETLEQSERDAVKSKSAVLEFTGSAGVPINISTSILQPFVIASDWQDFSFILDIKNLGGGTPYHPSSNYQLLSPVTANQTTFTATANYTLACEIGTGNIISLATSRSIVCRIPAKKADIGNYMDVVVDIRLDYAYLYSINSTLVVK